MEKFYRQIAVLFLGSIFAAACTTTSIATPTAAAALPKQQSLTFTPTTLPAAIDNLPATSTPSTIPATPTPQTEPIPERTDSMKIKITINDAVITATMADNETAQDFISLLPLTLKLEDYADTEKVSDLPRRLSTADAPAGYDPSIGDITYYSPWGNLAIFIRDFGYANGLIHLGKFEGDIGALSIPGPIEATFELID